jgi:hypothetical protein
MIVKIAYSSAVAEFGLESFNSIVREIILGQSEHLPHFVGCMTPLPVMSESRFSDGTHRVFYGLIRGVSQVVSPAGIQICHTPEYFAAALRLFKDMGSPTYLVILGTPGVELRQKLRAGDSYDGSHSSKQPSDVSAPEDL